MHYEPFPKDQLYAVKTDPSGATAPAGWPVEVAEVEEGDPVSAGFRLMTGSELNVLRDALAHEWPAIEERIKREALDQAKWQQLGQMAAAQQWLQSILDGTIANHIGGAGSFDELMLLRQTLPQKDE